MIVDWVLINTYPAKVKFDAAVLHIRYVHELQHALRLYGIWKKIEL